MKKIDKPINSVRQTPPRWATRMLRWFCAPHLLEEVQGDLQEEFEFQVRQAGLVRARMDYVRNVFGFMKPFAVKRKKTPSSQIHMSMIRHYFIVAFRNLLYQKTYSGINVAGLALGMICCLFIYMWVRDEQAVDNFHSNGSNLYSVFQTTNANGRVEGSYSTPFPLLYQNLKVNSQAEANAITELDLQQTLPEIQRWCPYATGYELPWGHSETFQVGHKIQKFDGSRAGKDFFSMFNYPLVAGQAETALNDISSIALSRSMASYFFASPDDAIGKSIRYENRLDFIVTSVFEDVTPQSTLQFDFLINWDAQIKKLEWATPVVLVTLQVRDGASVPAVEAKLNQFLQSRMDKSDPNKPTVGLRPYGERYLYGNFVDGKPLNGRITYVRIFTGVAILILVVACINFMNLATARSIKRAKEVGVRKTIGSSRLNLIFQFFGESILLSLVAMVVSIVLVQLLLPAFNSVVGKQVASPLFDPSYYVLFAVVILVAGVIAGLYPALYLSSLKPASILKGGLRFSGSAEWLRKGLVCFQFVLSIGLLISTVVISRQTDFVEHQNLGYDRDNLVYIQVEGDLNAKYAAFKQRAMTMPGITMVDRSSEAPHAMGFVVDDNDGFAENNTNDDAINWEGKDKYASVGFKPTSVGFDFIKLMDLKVIEGRGFSSSRATDSSAFLVNEEAVKQMGMKDPIGKWISAWQKKGTIIGVLQDYHTNTMRERIKPLIVDVKEDLYFGVVLVRLEAGKTKEALANLEKVYRDINPAYPFSYKFIDQEYAKMYRAEEVVSQLTRAFATLGVSISCLGLLGLVMLAAEQRTKEMGIRKVLGASVGNIVNLLTKEFLTLVLISFLVPAPITAYLMEQWLLGFAYQISLSWWIFGFSGLLAIAIALLTISLQAYHSATANPVKSLRSE